MFHQKSASSHSFAMVPKSDIPRSKFPISKTLKKTFDAGNLVPCMVEPVFPGDTFNVRMTSFARLATPIFPFMDNLYYETFFFFVPMRLAWTNFQKFMGEQSNPGDSISFTIPQVVSPVGGYVVGSVADHMGLPTVGQIGGANTFSVSALPFRMFYLIYNNWFRDENIVASIGVATDDGPDSNSYFNAEPPRRGKRHDYFTSALPFVQKGTSSSYPLSGLAPVIGNGIPIDFVDPGAATRNLNVTNGTTTVALNSNATATGGLSLALNGSNMNAQMSGISISMNQFRQAIAVQQLLEKDARGGTRYTETTRVHWGVTSPDARLQRPEYLGGGSTPIVVNEVQQNSQTGLSGGATPMGTLAATGRVVAHHGFSQSFTEHGYIIGICNVRADLTYQQGIRRHWSYLTRYDFPYPTFANLGEQAILNKEIYATGGAADSTVFGYQERYGECRYNPSEIHGLFRSTAAGTIDPWHLSQKFTSVPTLSSTFIQDTPPISRVVAVGAGANGQQFLLDAFFEGSVARALPTYGVPGLVRF